jgi:hypothetical protein
VSVFFPATPDAGFSLRTEAVSVVTSAIICVGLVWRYGAANLSLRDRVVAHPPALAQARVANPAEIEIGA